jgi:hypothetical protein
MVSTTTKRKLIMTKQQFERIKAELRKVRKLRQAIMERDIQEALDD